MGRVFVIEKEGDVYTCSSCATQIAHRDDFLADWGNKFYFSNVYNVTIGEERVSIRFGADGYELFCVNCCRFLGWKELDPHDIHKSLKLFAIEILHVVPPPEILSPPPSPENLSPPPSPENLSQPPSPENLSQPPSPENLSPPPSPGNLSPPPPEVQP